MRYEDLKTTPNPPYYLEHAPEKVLQFGEGNFLRAFADYYFDIANEKAGWNGKCVIIKPRNTPSPIWQQLNQQQGLYTVYLRGMERGVATEQKRIISSVSRCIHPYEPGGFQAMLEVAASDDLSIVVSNTTEAGIVFDPNCRLADRPADSFPGKLTQVLYHRWQHQKPGLVILSCELIDRGGQTLQQCVLDYCVLWQLPRAFEEYIRNECLFCSTLVDRIVPGKAEDPADPLAVAAEPFGTWIIEGPAWLENLLPLREAGLSCQVVPDVTPYKQRKVRILNGAHTGIVPGAYLAGMDIVRDAMHNDTLRGFMLQMLHREILPTLSMDSQQLQEFTDAVLDRFRNPFIDHALLSIALNTTSKWRTRNLPSLLDRLQQTGQLPPCLCMSLAAYIAFYSCNVQALTDRGLQCRRPQGDVYTCQDDREVLELFWNHRLDTPEDLVHAVLSHRDFWGMDLSDIPGLEALTVSNLTKIRQDGILAAMEECYG